MRYIVVVVVVILTCPNSFIKILLSPTAVQLDYAKKRPLLLTADDCINVIHIYVKVYLSPIPCLIATLLDNITDIAAISPTLSRIFYYYIRRWFFNTQTTHLRSTAATAKAYRKFSLSIATLSCWSFLRTFLKYAKNTF